MKFTSILSNSQSEESKKKLSLVIDDFNQWEMAGAQYIINRPLRIYLNSHLHAALERAIHATKSFVIALALVKRRLNVDQASDAAGVEVNSQIERWGEVEDSEFKSYNG